MIGSASPASSTPALSALFEEATFRIIISTPVTIGDFGVGDDHQVDFTTPGVDASRAAVLHLRVRGVQCNNTITINGVGVTDALVARDGDELDDFYSEIGRVPPNVLRANGNNTLRIASASCFPAAPDNGNRDDFTVDNVVLVYRQP